MKIIRYALIIAIMAALNIRAESQGYSEWLKHREALKHDGSVVRYYTFEGVENNKSKIPDLSGKGGTLSHYYYRYPNWEKPEKDDMEVVEGRWPEKKAVQLNTGMYIGPEVVIENKQFSVECWFRKSSAAGKEYSVRLVSVFNGWNSGWNLNVSTSAVQLSIGGIGRAGAAAKNVSIQDNVWHHLAGTWDGNTIRLYLNGEFIAETSHTGEYISPAAAGKTPFWINNYNKGINDVKIDMDEVVIYNRVLSQEEIIAEGGKAEAVTTAGNIDTILKNAYGYMKAGDYKNARVEYARLKDISTLTTGKEMSLFNIAECYDKEKNYADVHKTYGAIFSLPGLTPFYRIYGLFKEAEVYLEQNNYSQARKLYQDILNTDGVLEHHKFKARLFTGDTYRIERKYSQARGIYETLLKEQDTSKYPHEGYRLDLRERLEGIEGLADGKEEKSEREKRVERVNSPKQGIYVSLQGKDTNPGTKKKPFATIKRAQEEVRKRKEKGMPKGGIAVYIRGGKYFIAESITFGQEDSGTPDAPVVYRSYPGEEVRIIGGRQVDNFKLLDDPDILRRLPEESHGKIWVTDLKASGITTNYGQLLPRGSHYWGTPNHGAMELIYNGRVMELARWPNEGWVTIAALVNPEGEGLMRGEPYERGKFIYSGNRPERWTEETDIWLKGYIVVRQPYELVHARINNIDTKKKVLYMAADNRWSHTYPLYDIPVAKNQPYFAYNLLSELDKPGEWYLNRQEGKLYFFPPDKNIRDGETIVSTLDAPLIIMDDTSNVVFFGLTIEETWRNAVEIRDGKNNLIAGSIIRNTGQYAVRIYSGWQHAVVGCDIYDTGEGGISMEGGDEKELMPAKHYAENNHIYRFNRFDGGTGSNAARIGGVGSRFSHNLVNDTPLIAITFTGNDHIIEFNEIHDVLSEGKELGSIYLQKFPLLNRGTVIRNNFFHHITDHYSPNTSHTVCGIHIDGLEGGLVMEGNVFYRIAYKAIGHSGPDTRFENNLFVEIPIGIEQWNRNDIVSGTESSRDFFQRRLNLLNYNQPPWSRKYPLLSEVYESGKPIGWPKNIVVERNVIPAGTLIAFGGDREDIMLGPNWQGGNPYFIDPDNMNFNILPGSPAFGFSGHEPIPFDSIGLYNDPLRASWPVKREVGKYYNPDKAAKTGAPKRISKLIEYEVSEKINPITIDGMLTKEEWLGLDRKKALAVEQFYSGEKKEGPKSCAWLLYDDRYLYIGIHNEPDPWQEGMDEHLKKFSPVIEIAIEGQKGPAVRGWWVDEMPTGPIYILWGRQNGESKVIPQTNMFTLSSEAASQLETGIEYKTSTAEDGSWRAEWKIPLSAVNINPETSEKQGFNISIWGKRGWFTWVPTGGPLWLVQNAGIIRFAR